MDEYEDVSMKILTECLHPIENKGDIPPVMLRRMIRSKLRYFRDWTRRFPDRSSPRDWGETLTKFAKVINPFIEEYNSRVPETDRLLYVTPFAQGLVQRMECFERDDDYFFLNQGKSYDPEWRRDAVLGLLHKKLPRKVVDWLNHVDLELFSRHITPELAYNGGEQLMDALRDVGVELTDFTFFLRSYYGHGAFLFANLM